MIDFALIAVLQMPISAPSIVAPIQPSIPPPYWVDVPTKIDRPQPLIYRFRDRSVVIYRRRPCKNLLPKIN